jgi:outer membrane protein OmpA-like peptidoglycan-associated protein
MAQKNDKADKLFENKSFSDAIELYKKLPPSKETLLKLGDSYYFTLDVENAANIYETLYSTYKDSLPESFYFRYADALKGVNKYYKADEISKKYLGKETNTEAFRDLLEKVVPFYYELSLLNTPGGQPVFAGYVQDDKLIYSSPSKSSNRKYSWNNKAYLDLFSGKLNEESSLDSIAPYSKKLNSKSHESGVAITKDGQTIFFSRTDLKRHDIDGVMIATVKLYKASWNGEDWDAIEVLPFSSDRYSVQHPALNPAENRLYFSSDMSGGHGSFDLYYVAILEDGTFGDPVNLGSTINTAHREHYPFVDTDSTLYFASNGHFGFGGLDVFSSKLQSDGYLSPLNLGEGINSSKDDFAYTKGKNDSEGFISSNRNGTDQIYHFLRIPKDRSYAINGLVIDKNSKLVLPETQVTLYNKAGDSITSVMSDEFGRYELPTEPNKYYNLEAYRPLYIPARENFNTNDSGNITFDIELNIESYDDAEDIVIAKEDGYTYIELENIYFDLDRWEIKEEAARTLDILVELLLKYPKMEIELGAHTDSRANPDYNLDLSQKRADAAMAYILSKGIKAGRIIAKGYGETQPLVDCGDNCSDVEYAINRRCEFIIQR